MNNLPLEIQNYIYKFVFNETIKELNLYFYYNQYYEDKYTTFRAADLIDDIIIFYD